jgi:hypothetical protein
MHTGKQYIVCFWSSGHMNSEKVILWTTHVTKGEMGGMLAWSGDLRMFFQESHV